MPALEMVRQACDVRLDPPERQLAPEILRQAVVGQVGILCVVTDRIDAQVFAAAPTLKVVANVAVGYDNIDVPAATQRGIVVTNTPGVLTDTTADLTWGLLLSMARRIPEGDRYVRAGKWDEWDIMFLFFLHATCSTHGVFTTLCTKHNYD